MRVQALTADRRPMSSLAEEVRGLTMEGREVVLVFGDGVHPKRIEKVLAATLAGYEVKVFVRHAELGEYVTNAAKGAGMGAAAGIVVAVVGAVAAGTPITWPLLAGAAAIGALAGGVAYAGATPIAEVRIYKYKGQTRMKFLPSLVAGLESMSQ